MGRIGVGFNEVQQAALQLQGKGKTPTVDGIREILGTGSKTTIAQHLKEWKGKQENSQGKLPQELLTLVAGIWERTQLLAEERVNEIQQSCANQINAMQQSAAQYQQELITCQKQLQSTIEEHAAERLNKEQYQQRYQTERQEHAKLDERYQLLTQHLENAKSENVRLHQLASHIQANLEHYQHAILQLQNEQNLAIEKQQSYFQQEINYLKQQLTQAVTQQHLAERLHAERNYELKLLREEQGKLVEDNATLSNQHQQQFRECLILNERCEQIARALQEERQKSEQKNILLSELTNQLAVLSDQNPRLQQEINQANNLIETLRQEKIRLMEERSQLQIEFS